VDLHYRRSHRWKDLGSELAKSLSSLMAVDPLRHDVRLHRTALGAIRESLLGLRRQYSLKKQVLYFKNQDPNIDQVIKLLAAEGLQIEVLSSDVLRAPDPAAVAGLAAKITKDTLFVVYAVDDPVLDEVRDVGAFEAALQATTALRVRVSYATHFFRGPPAMDRNVLHVLGLREGFAATAHGERVRHAPQGVEIEDWEALRDPAAPAPATAAATAAGDLVAGLVPRLLAGLQGAPESAADFQSRRALVEAFEARTDLGFRPLLPASSEAVGAGRNYDRAMIVWDDLDSQALCELLASRQVQSLSLSRWGGFRPLEWLQHRGLSSEILQGAAVIDWNALQTDRLGALVDELRTRRQKILRLQSGDL
jgi:hypothetical protein